jgi:Kdo2-lipid IVA lauroyltransferase/acyltransferase
MGWLTRLLFWLIANTPGDSLARFTIKLVDIAVPKLRRTAIRNLEIAKMPASLVDGVFASLARTLAVFTRLPSINAQNISAYIRYEGFEHYEEAKRRGKGVLFATAHLGNWELSAYAHALMTEPMNIVVRPLDIQASDEVVEARRAGSGNRIISKQHSARDILRALKLNQPVGILIDQNVSLEEGTFIDFFGTPACAGTAFARIAAHSGAAVIPGFAFWIESERRYTLKFYPLVDITGEAIEDTRRIHAVIEQAIREHPEQWLWLHRRWKTRPPGQPPLY